MELTFKTVRSGGEPPLLDTTSSKVYNYIRKNVRTEEVNIGGGEREHTVTMYVYDEAKLTKDEYKIYEESLVASANNDAVQVAIAEVAELVDSYNTTIEQAIAELAEAVLAE